MCCIDRLNPQPKVDDLFVVLVESKPFIRASMTIKSDNLKFILR